MGLVKYIVVILLLIPSISWGACTWSGNTCVMDSCAVANQTADIEEVRTNKSNKTGVVTMQLPACDEVLESATSASVVPVNMSSGFAGITGLIIRGDGAESSMGSNGTTKFTNINYRITASASKSIRISNITFAGAPYNQYAGYGAHIKISGSTVYPNGGFRFDHLTFDDAKGKAFYGTGGSPFGVIESCNGRVLGQASTWDNNADTSGNDSWQSGASLGSVNAVYFENNSITAVRDPGASDGNQGILMISDGGPGSRIVDRYNELTNYYFGGHDCSSNQRAQLQLEAYNNIMTHTNDITNYDPASSYTAPPVGHRGGTGVIYSNDFIQVENQSYYTATAIYLRNVRDTGAGSSSIWTTSNAGICDADGKKACLTGDRNGALIMCTSDADCGGASGSCQYVDGDGVSTKLPCRDQIGTGDNASPQSSKPFLVWNNRQKKGAEEYATSTVTSTVNIVENRDYCQHATTMPATCNGVETTYTAYTCPHPATGYTGTCSTSVTGNSGYNIDEAADETAPTVSQATIPPAGTSVIFTFDEPITATSGAAFTLDFASAVTLTCPAVETAATSMTCTTSRTITQAEGNSTFDYTGTKVINEAEIALGAISNQFIYNKSTQIENPPALTLTISNHTGAVVTSSPSGLNCGSTCSADFENGTVVTVGGYCLQNYTGFTVGGEHCASNGTVTVNGAKSCTATCTKISPDVAIGTGAAVTLGSGAVGTLY